ncbi:14539_t:CDS:1, partial [Cetraspora pellucida]
MEISPSPSPSLLSFESEDSETMSIQSTFDLGLESVATTNDRSLVWKYFKKHGSSARCDICGSSLTYSDGSTSNLRKHLKRRNHINK